MARVKVVYGPPCSGKSTYVNEAMKPKDIRFNYDLLLQAISSRKSHEYSDIHLPYIMSYREYLIKKAASDSSIDTAYIITCKIREKFMHELKNVGAEFFLIDRSREECYDLLKEDDTRKDKIKWRLKIDEWFEWYEEWNQRKEVKRVEIGEVRKTGQLGKESEPESQMGLINRFTLEPLTADDVFCFKINACGNKIDRDKEMFSDEALEKLAALYVGKSVIFDHAPTAKNQCARIYHAEVLEGQGKNEIGSPVKHLQLHCYMVKTEKNNDLIAEIRAGIKREVSVGCAVTKAICNICGGEYRNCSHRKGEKYEGKECFVTLDDATDAYEVSFVAVPAQKDAGVTKAFLTGKTQTEETERNKASKKFEAFVEVFGGVKHDENKNEKP